MVAVPHITTDGRGFPKWVPCWNESRGSKGLDVGVKAFFWCPKGHLGAIAESHEIAADGTVSPSCVCSSAGCNFHDYVQLVGWHPPDEPDTSIEPPEYPTTARTA